MPSKLARRELSRGEAKREEVDEAVGHCDEMMVQDLTIALAQPFKAGSNIT